MTPEQRYFFDIAGYLHLENALGEEELRKAREAADRYMNTPPDQLPPGFEIDGWRHTHGFAFDKALEALAMHPSFWPIIRELTYDRPRLGNGTLIVDRRRDSNSRLHCAREGYGWPSTRYGVRDGRIFCDDLVVFPYLDDVNPGDDGLVVVPGSHKAEFERPEQLYYDGLVTTEVPDGVVNVTPRAGDVVIISELLTHGTMPWQPEDRVRRALVLRFKTQNTGTLDFPPEVLERLSPRTRDLVEPASFNTVKEIVKEQLA